MKILFLILCLFFSFNHNTWGKNIHTEFLIAKPSMLDSRFKETVILLLYHNQEKGAAGLVINKPINKMLISEFFKSSNIVPPDKMLDKEITIYWGGPVNHEHIFFIHSSDYISNDFISSNKNFTITRETKVLFDIVTNKGPKEFIILLGIAAWEPGQLDSEIKQNNWHRKLNNYTSLFNNGKEMWKQLIYSQDI